MPATGAKPIPGPGFVRIYSTDPPLSVLARLWSDKPNVDGGYGGWQEIARPRRRPLTSWIALPALRVSLPLLLDGWRWDVSVEQDAGQIERMGFPTASDGRPPRVRFATSGGAVPHKERLWVVEDLTWGDALMDTDGNRVRQQVTVHLMEFMEDLFVTQRSAAMRARTAANAVKTGGGALTKRTPAKGGGSSKGKSRAATVALFDGEDLATLAARELGDASRWTEIAALNGIRDPQAVRRGQVLRLP